MHLNAVELALGTNDELPRFEPAVTAEGTISLAPATITFLAIPNASNPAWPITRHRRQYENCLVTITTWARSRKESVIRANSFVLMQPGMQTYAPPLTHPV